MSEERTFNPKLAGAINEALAVKPEEEKSLTWDDAKKIDKDLGRTLATIMAYVKLLLKRPAIIKSINEDKAVAHDIKMFNRSIMLIVEEMREIRGIVGDRTGKANDEEIYEISEIYLKYMNISERMEGSKRNISVMFTTQLNEEYARRIEEEDQAQMEELAKDLKEDQGEENV